MELLSNLGAGLSMVLGGSTLLVVVIGVVLGILVGAMPGLSPSMGVALLVPFTYAMDPTTAIILLVAIYIASNYGGSITAVTINAPGTPSSSVTCFDGYPLTLQGKPGMGLGVSLFASTIGGFLGSLILIFFSVPLARIALNFHPAEYFALAVFGLATVASLAGRNWIKAFIATLIGLLINTIGIDPISGVSRFTFGLSSLYDGFSLIPMLIGLFAVSEILTQIETSAQTGRAGGWKGKTPWPRWRDYWKLKFTVLRSSTLGTVIGIFPGAGATIASFLSYDLAKRMSRRPDEFGKGSLEGVAAAEAADSSSVGGALLPLLTLGIPGSATDAVLIGALMIHDIVPGPQLFETNGDMIYGLFAGLLVANLVLFGLGLFGSKLWVKVTSVPKAILYPLILAVSIIGSFAVRYAMFDVLSCIGFGIFGWVLRRHHYPVAPVILGMVLGQIAELNFRQAVMMSGYGVFWERPVSLIILLLALASFGLPFMQQIRKAEKVNEPDADA